MTINFVRSFAPLTGALRFKTAHPDKIPILLNIASGPDLGPTGLFERQVDARAKIYCGQENAEH